MDFLSKSPGQTKKLGSILAKEILGKSALKNKLLKQELFFQGRAFVIGLTGELGGGKTTFLQGFASGLGIKEKVLSPTFIIMRKAQLATNDKQLTTRNYNKPKVKSNKLKSHFYHIDCYRIEKPKEILDLGFKEIISGPQNIVAIEWADKIKKILPKNMLWINLKFIGKEKRKVIIGFKRAKNR